ncbi:MAG: septal ring lytic transglycosylase RlpA family protein [Hyphomicrobiaceae bacterium]
MRITLLAAAALAAFGLANPASAATHWACMGGYVACGAPAKAAPTYAKAKKATYKASKKSHKSSYKTASLGDDYSYVKPKKAYKSKSSGSSYSGGYSGGTSGMASYYWQPQKVASGGWFNPNAMTAAHKTLPFGTKVRVTNARNGRSVVVTINDRGPFIKGRVIDLSRAAAGAIGMINAGVAPVNVAVIGK